MSTLYVDNLEPNLGSRVMAAGHVVQVVHSDGSSASYNATTSASYVEFNSALRTSITPTSSSSKILVMGGLGVGIDRQSGSDANGQIRIREVNSGSAIAETGIRVYDRGGSGIYLQWGQTLAKLYAPNTTSELTYTFDMRLIAGQDIRTNDENKATYITLMEIAQ